MLSHILSHGEAILAIVNQAVIVPIRDLMDASIPMLRSLHITLAPALWGGVTWFWSRHVKERCPDPPMHPDDWPNGSYGYLPTCKYVWENWMRLCKENNDSEAPRDFEAILQNAINEYENSPEKRGKIPKKPENLRDSLHNNCGLTEQVLADWPSPESVRGIYWRKGILQTVGCVVAGIVILIVTALFAMAYRSLDVPASAA